MATAELLRSQQSKTQKEKKVPALNTGALKTAITNNLRRWKINP